MELFAKSSLIKFVDCCKWWDARLCVEDGVWDAFARATIYRGG